MKKFLKELFVFLAASACAGVLSIFVVWAFLVHFPFDLLSDEPPYQEHIPHRIQTLTSSTLSEAETTAQFVDSGRTDFSK
ncbi:hypothetical protein CF95_gp129 [Erwinia phage PhiEaH1]|uniref:Uncharacterized protein n=1 Tax=Erwinia phage PhiEaH1 TaxID=1401669 RepID=W8CZM8_9CAUD|nr:hypothetical protein CF95_gp129 [Erwinia phage PhiEaH1]AGX01851.1 hypothetical protein [Erwinia phage PhiEaH1]WBF04712.1 hypothetical protein [Erwinia phage vB_Ea277G]